ncbi:MAG: hypothetical protein MZU91_02280 [Desulfosudis oleivorans]|nr:hypothetical protein [Desulfosudis oleivorans]
MAKINFGGVEEEVVTRDEFPLEKAREVLKNEVVAVLGYGVQGPAQAMNMRDNGIKVIVGQREGTSELGQGRRRRLGAGRDAVLRRRSRRTRHGHPVPAVGCRSALAVAEDRANACNEGDMLYFSHGFSVTYKDDTGVIPPPHVDVVLVAPKGSGTQRPPQLPGRQRASTPASPSTRIAPAAPTNAPSRWASPSARAICSRPPSRTKSTAT